MYSFKYLSYEYLKGIESSLKNLMEPLRLQYQPFYFGQSSQTIKSTKTYLGQCKRFIMTIYVKIVNSFQPLAILVKCFIIDIWQGPKYTLGVIFSRLKKELNLARSTESLFKKSITQLTFTYSKSTIET